MNKKQLDRFYARIFNMDFLIRYGYYDFPLREERKNREGIENIEQYGKADNFYYQYFNLDKFTDVFNNNESLERLVKDYLKDPKKKESESISYAIPKTEYSRREYKMPNLLAYAGICKFIVDNKSEFIETFKNNEFSTSKFFNMFHIGQYENGAEIRSRLLFSCKNRIHLDLSNFYHTLYTHSIPWIVIGKKESKANRETGFANDLDLLIRNCQFGETHGIPTGNLVTRIIAEYYMCKFDEKMKEQGFRYHRYVDDITFPYNYEKNLEKFLSYFNKLCKSLNLNVNDKKTKIDKYPFVSYNSKEKIFYYFEKLTISTKNEQWTKEISSFIDYCIAEEASGNKGAVKCIYPCIKNALKRKKISSDRIIKILFNPNALTGLKVFEKIIDTSMMDSRLSNRFIQFTEDLIAAGVSKKKISNSLSEYFKEYHDVLYERLEEYKLRLYNQEIYQILLYVSVFEINTFFSSDVELLSFFDFELDDYCYSLVVKIYLLRKYELEKLFKKINGILEKDYNPASRMRGQLWFFRYTIYRLAQDGTIKKEINRSCKTMNIKQSKNGQYESELNWNYVKGKSGNDIYSKFYNCLLINGIDLVINMTQTDENDEQTIE